MFDQRYIAYFVVYVEPRYIAYLSAPISSAALRAESVALLSGQLPPSVTVIQENNALKFVLWESL